MTGLNCNGNPLHPDREVSFKHAGDIRKSIQVAALLGVKRVVTMSGLPAAHAGGLLPAWSVNPWDSAYLDALDYQWQDVAVPFWKEIQAFAADNDVKVCIEMHPQNLVFNAATMLRLVEQTNANHVGAEMGVHGSYQALLDDPELEVIYNALVNSQHARWNIAALRAGKHVLSEKPFTANSDQALAVREVATSSDRRIVEGFHYLHHPMTRRLRQIVESGQLGGLRHVEIDMQMAAPPDDDPRWSYELAGGALMDIGCSALHACRQLGRWTSGEPRVVSAKGGERTGRPEVDEWMTVELEYPDGLPGPRHGTWYRRTSG